MDDGQAVTLDVTVLAESSSQAFSSHVA